tara:strand:- start:381 stop:602 length:222 start_codon:yes stop_codon:yes gene_type:complete
MKIAERLERLAEKHGCEVDDDGFAWTLWLPEGVEWNESGAPCLVEQYATLWQSWKPDAIRELEDRASCGVDGK